MSSITINPSHAYVLIGGMVIGKFANLFSGVVIAGLVLYIVTPKIYTIDRIERTKNYLWSFISPTQNLINNYQTMTNGQQMLLLNQHQYNQQMGILPDDMKIEIVNKSPEVNTSTNSSIRPWSPLHISK